MFQTKKRNLQKDRKFANTLPFIDALFDIINNSGFEKNFKEIHPSEAI